MNNSNNNNISNIYKNKINNSIIYNDNNFNGNYLNKFNNNINNSNIIINNEISKIDSNRPTEIKLEIDNLDEEIYELQNKLKNITDKKK